MPVTFHINLLTVYLINPSNSNPVKTYQNYLYFFTYKNQFIVLFKTFVNSLLAVSTLTTYKCNNNLVEEKAEEQLHVQYEIQIMIVPTLQRTIVCYD